VGSFYDGSRVRLSLKPVWVMSKYLELEAGYEVNRLDFADRGVATTAQLASLRVKKALNPKVSMSTFGQYNSATDQTSLNVRFRYHFREGTDLWIVYNEGFNNMRDDGLGPRRPLSSGRALLVKYSHTFARYGVVRGLPSGAAPRRPSPGGHPCRFSRSGKSDALRDASKADCPVRDIPG